MSTSRSFHARMLLNPRYLYGRLKGLRSFGEIAGRCGDLLLLGAKLLTGRYGKTYWERERRAYSREDLLRGLTDPARAHFFNRLLAESECMRQETCSAKPVRLRIVPTSACNLRCIMCGRIGNTGTLPYETVKKLWPLLPTVSALSWEGGEVFTAPYFKQLLGEIVAGFPHIEHDITTNALLIDDELADLLARCDARLTVSIDAVEKAPYERIRAGGRFEDLLAALDRLHRTYARRGRAPHLTLNTVVMKSTLDQLRLLPAFCREHGFERATLLYLVTEHLTGEDLFARPDPALIRGLAAGIAAARRECARRGIALECNFQPVLDRLTAGEAPRRGAPGPAGEKPLRCGRPWNSLFVYYDGTVRFGCECAFSIGDLAAESAEAIWNGGRARSFRRRMMDGEARSFCAATCVEGISFEDLSAGGGGAQDA